MNLFFHHVGQKGANEDFKKTILTQRNLVEIEEHLPLDFPKRNEVLNNLRKHFPNKLFNCWGVPAGAKTVIKNLKANDAVLLVESANITGKIPILGIVKYFEVVEMRELSNHLWGDSKFPYIFFFDTEILNLEWIEFLEHLDYARNFNPRGNFYKVADNKLAYYKSVSNYIQYLRSNYSLDPDNFIIQNDLSHLNEDSESYNNKLKVDLEKIYLKLNIEPQLKEGLEKGDINIKKIPRDSAFTLAIKRTYNNKCAISGLSIFSPDGRTELESAHIYPKSLDGSDDIRNGILLTRLLHWAFDCGWISISDDYKVLVKKDIPKKIDYNFISQWEGKTINLPENKDRYPHPIFLKAHRKLYGFE